MHEDIKTWLSILVEIWGCYVPLIVFGLTTVRKEYDEDSFVLTDGLITAIICPRRFEISGNVCELSAQQEFVCYIFKMALVCFHLEGNLTLEQCNVKYRDVWDNEYNRKNDGRIHLWTEIYLGQEAQRILRLYQDRALNAEETIERNAVDEREGCGNYAVMVDSKFKGSSGDRFEPAGALLVAHYLEVINHSIQTPVEFLAVAPGRDCAHWEFRAINTVLQIRLAVIQHRLPFTAHVDNGNLLGAHGVHKGAEL